jgi:hypothetical protein
MTPSAGVTGTFLSPSGRWLLGRYVELVAIAQLALYAAIALDRSIILLYADPRLALVPFLETLARPPHQYPLTVSWLSAVAFLGLGEAVVRRRRALPIYALAESAYVLLFTAFSVMSVPKLLRSHAVPPAALLVLLGIFAGSSAAPLFAAWRVWRART